MQLSVIIVNYNVKFFLQQCLYAVHKAIQCLPAEVIVIDNNSTDGSLTYLKPIFPWVQFIQNNENKGFGKANNIALQYAKGEFILFLNPDTIVPEDCFIQCVNFFRKTSDCGALGIKMIDGKGYFLPESKRSFPSPIASFFKLVGAAYLFPTSKIFNKYALGYLNKNNNHEVDVLAGAFLMTKKELLLKVGAFDETFFMYGEDVDLSYRLQQTGLKNYYFAQSTIIHFKGESTKRGSLNYVRMFYEAMSIFVSKHYKGSMATLFTITIKIAIILRAFLSIIKRFFTRIGLAIIDSMVIFLSIWLVKMLWVMYVRHGTAFLENIVNTVTPIYVLVFLTSAALAGMYDNLYKPVKAIAASFVAVIAVLTFYSLLPENVRFSRGVILFGGMLSGFMLILYRWALMQLGLIKETNEETKMQQTIIVGTQNEYDNAINVLKSVELQERVLGRIDVDNEPNKNVVGQINELEKITETLKIKEIIFCIGKLSYKQVIEQIQCLPQKINFKFYENESNCILGSNSKTTTGEILSTDTSYAISSPYQIRMKRIVDIFFSILLLLTFPIHVVCIKNGLNAIKNSLYVLLGKYTWVGYAELNNSLPKLKPAVVTNYGNVVKKQQLISDLVLQKLDLIYAKDYNWLQDVKTILHSYKKLGG